MKTHLHYIYISTVPSCVNGPPHPLPPPQHEHVQLLQEQHPHLLWRTSGRRHITASCNVCRARGSAFACVSCDWDICRTCVGGKGEEGSHPQVLLGTFVLRGRQISGRHSVCGPHDVGGRGMGGTGIFFRWGLADIWCRATDMTSEWGWQMSRGDRVVVAPLICAPASASCSTDSPLACCLKMPLALAPAGVDSPGSGTASWPSRSCGGSGRGGPGQPLAP